MQTIQTLLLVLQVFVALALIVFILIQHGKGADAGAAFGSGSSATVFGARGAGNFLTRATTVLSIVFLANSLLLGYLAGKAEKPVDSLLENETPAVLQETPGAQPPAVTGSIAVPAQSTTAEAAADDMPAAAIPPADAPVVDTPADVPVLPETAAPASDIPALPEQ